MMEAEQIARLFERQYKSLEKRNHDLMNMVTELSAKNTDLEAQLAARDAEIAAWLRDMGRGLNIAGQAHAWADMIEDGDYRKETP